MKKIISFVIVILLAFSLLSCVDSKKSDNNKIYTSIYPIYSLTKLVVGDKCDVELLLKPGVDSHDFNVSVSTVVDVADSALFIYTADFMEPWAKDLIVKLKNVKILNCSSNLNIEPLGEEHEHNGEHDLEEEYDPHIWTSLTYMKQIVNNIFNAVSDIDRENIEYYKNNKESLINDINELDSKYNELFNNYEDDLYFICPFQMYYFTKHYDIGYKSLYATCSEEVEPSLSDIMTFEDLIRNNNIKFVISNPFMSDSLANRIKTDCSVETIIINACETITQSDLDNNRSIIDIYESNYNILKEVISSDSN